MNDYEWNKQMTVGKLKEELKDIPDHVVVNVSNSEGEATSNIYVWFENLQTRKFVELQGYKPFYAMTEEEKTRCGH